MVWLFGALVEQRLQIPASAGDEGALIPLVQHQQADGHVCTRPLPTASARFAPEQRRHGQPDEPVETRRVRARTRSMSMSRVVRSASSMASRDLVEDHARCTGCLGLSVSVYMPADASRPRYLLVARITSSAFSSPL